MSLIICINSSNSRYFILDIYLALGKEKKGKNDMLMNVNPLLRLKRMG